MERITKTHDAGSSLLEGTVQEIIFQNTDNGYTVFDIDTGQELVTAVGVIPFLNEGESVKLIGAWGNHPSYGKQFKFEFYEKKLPDDKDSMLKYLSSRAIKGVGAKTAQRIIDRFGDAAFEVIEHSPELLSEIKGIPYQKAVGISESFKAQFGLRSAMIFFSEFFGPALSAKIYKRWGSASVDIVKNNPYILCDEIHGIGFERADGISAALGIDKHSQERICAGIKYVLKYNQVNNGHLYLPRNKLIAAARQLLDAEPEHIADGLARLKSEGYLIEYDFDRGEIAKAEDGKNGVYPLSVYVDEKKSALKILKMSSLNLTEEAEQIDRLIESVQISENVVYEPLQLSAIKNAVTHPVSVITGGPGTGKTTIIKAIIRVFHLLGIQYALAAPTGRAAKKMSQATLYEAKTIHRLLENEFTDQEEQKFFRNESNPLDYGAVIIDEASMLDSSLFASLVKALRMTTRLVLIGDCDQLPSVGAGNVLNDLIASERLKVCRLNKIYRQSSSSMILTNAHKINKGEYPDLSNQSSDFFFLPRNNAEQVASTIVDLLRHRLPKTYGDEILPKIQVLTSTKKSETGTQHLNALLQSVENPPDRSKTEKATRNIVLRTGDKVMQNCNNYNILWENKDSGETGHGIYNGDIGLIHQIDPEGETVTVDFDGKFAAYDFTMLDELEHAYVITIHKSQGSEYPVVILPLFGGPPMLMTRNLLYTAVTRAQTMVIVVGSRDTVYKMVDNNSDSRRYTGLSQLLRAEDGR